MYDIKECAIAYDKAVPGVKSRAAHGTLTIQTRRLFQELPQALRIIPTDDPAPYKDLDSLIRDIQAQTLMVYTENGPEWHTKLETVMSRATHDYYGHYKAVAGFDWEGECHAYKTHATYLKGNWAAKALKAEVLGQAAVKILTGEFPAQKQVVLSYQD